MSEVRQKKQLIGLVVSNKNIKTAVVQVERQILHRRYKKYIKRRKKYAAHDEGNTCNVGDLVMIQECRPLSKNKTWRVIKTLRKVESV